MTIEVSVDDGLCMGSRRCEWLLPEVFTVGEDGVARAADPSGADADRVIAAADGCPNFAITVIRDGEVVVSSDP